MKRLSTKILALVLAVGVITDPEVAAAIRLSIRSTPLMTERLSQVIDSEALSVRSLLTGTPAAEHLQGLRADVDREVVPRLVATRSPATLFAPDHAGIREIMNGIAIFYDQVQREGFADLRDVQTWVAALNPAFPLRSPEVLEHADWKTFVEYVWALHWHLFLPARLYVKFPLIQGRHAPQTWVIDEASYRSHWDPHIRSWTWLADMHFEGPWTEEASRFLGVFLGSIGLVDKDVIADAATEEFSDLMKSKADDPIALRQQGLMKEMVAGGHLTLEGYIQIQRHETEGEERSHSRAFRFAERHAHPDLAYQYESTALIADEILKPESPIQSYWKIAERPMGATPITELEAKLAGAIDQMRAALLSKDSETAYLVFLKFVSSAAAMEAERQQFVQAAQRGTVDTSIVQTAIFYRLYAQFFFSSLIRVRGGFRGASMSDLMTLVLRDVHDADGVGKSAPFALALLEKIYALHFWTDEERHRRLPAIVQPTERPQFPMLGSIGPDEEPLAPNSATRTAWKNISRFLIVDDPLPKQADGMIIFGSDLMGVAEGAANLVLRVPVRLAVPTGGKGRLTPMDWVNEAEKFADVMAAIAPHLRIHPEPRASKSQENAEYGWQILQKELGFVRSVIGLQIPLQSLRAKMLLVRILEKSGLSSDQWPKIFFTPAFKTILNRPLFGWPLGPWMQRWLFEGFGEVGGLLGLQDPSIGDVARTEIPADLLEDAQVLGDHLFRDFALPAAKYRFMRLWMKLINQHLHHPPDWSPVIAARRSLPTAA